jgi:uncharacterized protein (TIGR02271 family)
MASTTQSTVVAVFRNRSEAENALNDLKANGFSNDQIYLGSYSDTETPESSREWNATHHHEGGIKGWFKSLFGEEDDDTSDYRDYETAANRGGVIVSVQADEAELDRATRLLQKHNPMDINEEGYADTQATAAGSTAAGSTAARSTTAQASGSTGRRKKATDDLPASIPVVQEDLRIGKRSVLKGGVRVYSRVTEKPVEETVNLREEKVRVERQAVNRPAAAGDLRPGTEQVIEVEEYAEEPVVEKQARIVEEVRVSKDVSEREQKVRDTVRRQEVDVQNLREGGPNTGDRGAFDDEFRRDFDTRYASSGAAYDDYQPAYTFGYNAANDPRYQGRSWDEVEPDLRSNYGRQYPNSTWERMKDSIRYGWDKVTGRTRAAGAHGD